MIVLPGTLFCMAHTLTHNPLSYPPLLTLIPGTTAMYKAASRMAIANRYNPLRAKSPGDTPSRTDRGAESDDNPQPTSDDPGVDGVMPDTDSIHVSRPNSSTFDSRVQSASSFHSTHSQREGDSVTPNQNSGRRSQINSPYDISGNDQVRTTLSCTMSSCIFYRVINHKGN